MNKETNKTLSIMEVKEMYDAVLQDKLQDIANICEKYTQEVLSKNPRSDLKMSEIELFESGLKSGLIDRFDLYYNVYRLGYYRGMQNAKKSKK